MTDIELLTLSAMAAGIKVVWEEDGQHFRLVDGFAWNPLEDDGDALRLLVDLKLDLRFNYLPHAIYVFVCNFQVSIMETVEDSRIERIDRPAAIRRAIVLAAAELGKTIKEKS